MFASEQELFLFSVRFFTKLSIKILAPKKSELEKDAHNLPVYKKVPEDNGFSVTLRPSHDLAWQETMKFFSEPLECTGNNTTSGERKAT